MSRFAVAARRSIGALLLLLPLIAEPAIASEATPALWTLTKPNGHTITFLGSIHVLKPEMTWRTPAINAAFERADVVALEIDIDEGNSPASQALVFQLGLYNDGTSLFSKLTQEQQTSFDAAVAAVNVPRQNFDRMRPWLASLFITLAYVQQQGFAPGSGVDMQIHSSAKMHGKPMVFFETFAEQMAMFANLPEDIQLQYLNSTTRDITAKPEALAEMIDMWARGDAVALGALINSGLSEIPSIKTTLLDARNAKWVAQIQTWMADDKDYLVVVGAGHLSGEGSVIALLRQSGVEIAGP